MFYARQRVVRSIIIIPMVGRYCSATETVRSAARLSEWALRGGRSFCVALVVIGRQPLHRNANDAIGGTADKRRSASPQKGESPSNRDTRVTDC
jgi:hypothetical protein